MESFIAGNLSGHKFKADNHRRVHICKIHCVRTYLKKEGVATYVTICKVAFSHMENEYHKHSQSKTS